MLGNFQSPDHTRKSTNKIGSFLKGIVEVRDDEVYSGTPFSVNIVDH
jgi:hypothetical protein